MSIISRFLNESIANNAAEIVADSAKAKLIRSNHTLSGEDSGLVSTWNEICVQVQGEQSADWDAYEAAMRDAILGVLLFLDWSVLATLWLHTEEGRDLRDDFQAAEESGLTSKPTYELPEIPVDDEAIARHIMRHHLLQLTRDYTNPRIKSFLNSDRDSFDEDGDCDETGTDHQEDNSPSPVEVREIEYYDDTWDSSNYLVCINRYYIFAIHPDEPNPKWEFLHPDGPRWDAVHQRVYRNFRSDCIEIDQLPANLPPPPDSIDPDLLRPLPPPPPEIFLRADYPSLDKRLQKCNGAMPDFLVLMEDLYESHNGDGKFHYPETLFFTHEEAHAFNGTGDGNYAYHVRAGLLWLNDMEICCKVPRWTFDHFSNGEVMRLAEKLIKH